MAFRSSRRFLAALLLAGALLSPAPGFSQNSPPPGSFWSASGPEVDVALVLAVDISYSMDLQEQALQREGYIKALTSPVLLDAIGKGMLGKIAVSYLEWAGTSSQHVVVDWQVIEDLKSAQDFVARIEAAPIRRARRTSISGAIDFSIARLKAAPFRPLRRVIDISGDGPNNEGITVTTARDRALATGVTINGLPIILNRNWNSSFDIDNLDSYYRDCVIGGPGAFMVTIRDRAEFASAIKLKILREVADLGIADIAPRLAQSGATDCTVGERQWRRNWEQN